MFRKFFEYTIQWEFLRKLKKIIYKKFPLLKEQGVVSNLDLKIQIEATKMLAYIFGSPTKRSENDREKKRKKETLCRSYACGNYESRWDIN